MNPLLPAVVLLGLGLLIETVALAALYKSLTERETPK